MKALLGSQEVWEVVENGPQEPTDIEEHTIVQLVVLRATRVKHKAPLYALYWAVDESDFEKITNAKFWKDAWDISKKAYQGDHRVK